MTDTVISDVLQIVLIFVVAFLIKKFALLPFKKILRNEFYKHGHVRDEEQQRRAETIIEVFNIVLSVVVYAIAVMMSLKILSIDIQPLLTSAGIIGVALGFGAQWLIKDIISGLFIITENQYRIGDSVSFNTLAGIVSGNVEDITLRTTMIRDIDGNLHHVPNGSIVVSTNRSKDFAHINLTITVAYDSNIEQIKELIDAIGEKIFEESAWSKKIIEKPYFMRVDNFASSGVVVKIGGKTKPLKQWEVRGELRRRILEAFEDNDIEIPVYPELRNTAETR